MFGSSSKIYERTLGFKVRELVIRLKIFEPHAALRDFHRPCEPKLLNRMEVNTSYKAVLIIELIQFALMFTEEIENEHSRRPIKLLVHTSILNQSPIESSP